MEMWIAWLIALMTGLTTFEPPVDQPEERHPTSYTGSQQGSGSQEGSGPFQAPPRDRNADIYNGF